MIFRGICLLTVDVPRLVEFYTKVLGVQAEGDDVHAVFGFGEAGITIYHPEGLEDRARDCPRDMRGNCFSFGFEVDDVDAEYERVKQLDVEFIELPTTHPWGWRSITLKDPDGNTLGFTMKVETSVA